MAIFLRKSSRRNPRNSKSEIYTQISDYIIYCRQVRNMSAETVKHKDYALKYFARKTGIQNLSELDNRLLNHYIADELLHCRADTVNLKVAQIVAMVKFFRENRDGSGFLTSNASGKVFSRRAAAAPVIPLNLNLVRKIKEDPPRRTFYTAEEIEQVLAATEDEMTWLLISISFDTGLRISELTHLRLENLRGSRIKFIGKGRRAREVYLTERTLERLEEWIFQEEITDYLWVNSARTGPLSTETIRIRMAQAFTRAGFPDFYPHALRHSFATDIQTRGASVLEMKEMLGHANVATTERYLHGLDGRLRELWGRYR